VKRTIYRHVARRFLASSGEPSSVARKVLLGLSHQEIRMDTRVMPLGQLRKPENNTKHEGFGDYIHKAENK
jgi:hypothetical protein